MSRGIANYRARACGKGGLNNNTGISGMLRGGGCSEKLVLYEYNTCAVMVAFGWDRWGEVRGPSVLAS